MEISIQKSNQLKSIAILMMLCLHLFNRPFQGVFVPVLFIGNQPLSYYISLFCDACVPIFAFVSGYGLFYKFKEAKTEYWKGNKTRIRNLYINYWIILFLFVLLLGSVLGKVDYIGDISTFFMNFTALNTSYNGAWWFMTIYLLFVITSSFWFQLLLKWNPIFYLILLLVLYILGFYFRIYSGSMSTSIFIKWLHVQSALYFCTLFQFMLGAFTLHYRWHSKISIVVQMLPFKNYLLVLAIVALVILHGLVPNFFIAPFIGLVFILIYCQMDISSFFQKIIDFFTPHATNIWLIHMFFYLIYFPNLIYSPKYPVLIFFWLVLWCLAASYLVNSIQRVVMSCLNKKIRF